MPISALQMNIDSTGKIWKLKIFFKKFVEFQTAKAFVDSADGVDAVDYKR